MTSTKYKCTNLYQLQHNIYKCIKIGRIITIIVITLINIRLLKDDALMHSSINNRRDTEIFQTDIVRLKGWAAEWGMLL